MSLKGEIKCNLVLVLAFIFHLFVLECGRLRENTFEYFGEKKVSFCLFFLFLGIKTFIFKKNI